MYVILDVFLVGFHTADHETVGESIGGDPRQGVSCYTGNNQKQPGDVACVLSKQVMLSSVNRYFSF